MAADGKLGGPNPAGSAIDAHVSASDHSVVFALDESQVCRLEKYIKISPHLLSELGRLVAEWHARNFEKDEKFNSSPSEGWKKVQETYKRVFQARSSIQGILYDDGAAIYIDSIRHLLNGEMSSVWSIEQELKKIIEETQPARGASGRKSDTKPEFTREIQTILHKCGMSLIIYNSAGEERNYHVEFLLLLLRFSNFGVRSNFILRYIFKNKGAVRKNRTRMLKHKMLKVSERTAENLIKAVSPSKL